MLLIKDYQIDDNIVDILKDEYNIFNGNVLMTKIELIRQLEELLMIDLVNINTKIDFDRFDEHVEIDDVLNDQIKKVFAIRKKENNNIKKFRYWYYQLIQMYKNILGSDIFIYAHLRNNNIQYYSYSLNDQILNKHKILFE
jgi:hypothetical protein